MLFSFTCALGSAQVNYVMNPSLEQYTNCPDKGDEINYAIHWTSLDSGWSAPDWVHDPYGVTEYCNACAAISSGVGVPYGSLFHCYPRTGNGMAQVQMFENSTSTDPYMRDYLQGHLCKPLIADQAYCVTFYVNLEIGSVNAVNHIGAYFDNGTIDTTHHFGLIQTQYTPQIIENSIIKDSINWVKVQGTFTSIGTEKYITIGNFTDSSHTSIYPLYDTTLGIAYGAYTWYLVDDISVIASNTIANAGPDRVIPTGSTDSVVIGDTIDTYLPVYWYVNGVIIDSNKASLKVHPNVTTNYVMALDVCGHITYDTVVVRVGNVGIINLTAGFDKHTITVYPNPVTDELTIENANQATFILYDVVGKEVYKTTISSDKETLNIAYLQKGVYVGQVVNKDGEKEIIRIIKE